jgi:hypothetical protein
MAEATFLARRAGAVDQVRELTRLEVDALAFDAENGLAASGDRAGSFQVPTAVAALAGSTLQLWSQETVLRSSRRTWARSRSSADAYGHIASPTFATETSRIDPSSVDTSKPAIDRHFKTGHYVRSGRDTWRFT